MECFSITEGSIVAAECISEPEPDHDLGAESQMKEDLWARRDSKTKEIVWMISDDNKWGLLIFMKLCQKHSLFNLLNLLFCNLIYS